MDRLETMRAIASTAVNGIVKIDGEDMPVVYWRMVQKRYVSVSRLNEGWFASCPSLGYGSPGETKEQALGELERMMKEEGRHGQ